MDACAIFVGQLRFGGHVGSVSVQCRMEWACLETGVDLDEEIPKRDVPATIDAPATTRSLWHSSWSRCKQSGQRGSIYYCNDESDHPKLILIHTPTA